MPSLAPPRLRLSRPRAVITRVALCPLIIFVSSSLFGSSSSSLAEAPRIAAAEHLRNLEFQRAARLYAHLPAASLSSADRLAWAAALLNAQPRTENNIREAAALFESIGAEDPNLRAAALFWLARLWQDHASPADPPRARELYARLVETFPDHPLAEIGVVRLTALDLADLPGLADHARWTEIEARQDLLRRDQPRRDFHWLFAQAWLDAGGDPARALPHLQTAARLGFSNRNIAANTLVQIAELARESGRPDLARETYRRFLSDYPRDGRRHLIAERLGALEAPARVTP